MPPPKPMLTFANFALRTESIFGCLGTDATAKPWAPKSRVPQFSAGDGDSSDEELIRTKPAEDMPTLFPTEERRTSCGPRRARSMIRAAHARP